MVPSHPHCPQARPQKNNPVSLWIVYRRVLGGWCLALARSKVDEFVPQLQDVNLRIVRDPQQARLREDIQEETSLTFSVVYCSILGYMRL